MRERISVIKGQKLALNDMKSAALVKYDQLNHDIDLAEKAKTYFAELKESSDCKMVELYSDLLTGIVHDVMSEYDQKVCLVTGVSRNKTTLDIHTIKKDKIEQVSDGRGGSISNLISAGLRFISLYKSANRRVILLDEADCWLERHLIPRFINVVERMSEQIGIQTIMISHHASDVVSAQSSRVVTLAHNKNNILEATSVIKNLNDSLHNSGVTTIVGDEAYQQFANVSDVGIRSLRLINVQSHTDTLIELSTGLTVINGGNDIGKSAISRAFSALLDNDFKDSLINHDKKMATVEITLEQGLIRWRFSRKSKVSLYQFESDGELLQEAECPSGEVPTFLHEVLGMGKVSGVDLHIADQRDPLFILHPSHSPSARAEMLNLGDQFKHLQIMMRLHDEQLRDDRKSLKAVRESINGLNDSLYYLSHIDSVEAAQVAVDEENTLIIDTSEASTIIAKLADETAVSHVAAMSLLNRMSLPVELEDTHDNLINQLSKDQPKTDHALSALTMLIANTEALTIDVGHEEIITLLEVTEDTDQQVIFQKAVRCLENIEQINTKALPNFDVTRYLDLINSIQANSETIDIETAELEKLLSLKSKMKVCPTCNQPIGMDAVSHEPSHYDHSQDYVDELASTTMAKKKANNVSQILF